MKRRDFLRYAGRGCSPLLVATSCSTRAAASPREQAAVGVRPNRDDALVVSDGLRWHSVISFGELLGSSGPFGSELFGYNNDWVCLFGAPSGAAGNERLLWVNVEYRAVL